MKVFKLLTYVPFEETIKKNCKANSDFTTPSNVVISQHRKTTVDKFFGLFRIIWCPFWILFLICALNILISLLNGILA